LRTTLAARRVQNQHSPTVTRSVRTTKEDVSLTFISAFSALTRALPSARATAVGAFFTERTKCTLHTSHGGADGLAELVVGHLVVMGRVVGSGVVLRRFNFGQLSGCARGVIQLQPAAQICSFFKNGHTKAAEDEV
jgi:hypothetical protein